MEMKRRESIGAEMERKRFEGGVEMERKRRRRIRT